MAIKMVREPSETPNINNIDDIVPMRYAYGNQNGYIIGKGNEISNTVNGLNFTVNSGRLVLQGVECDIDAVGVTITIDNIATKRYYVIYLQVNLGLNTAQILSSYDTATYPTIDAGDDLTENTTGVARLPLYRFTATSGVISEVNKIVESIKYINSSITVDNAKNINNLEIKRNESGVLKIGDTIIPQKILVWEGEWNGFGLLNLINANFKVGDIIQLEFDLYANTSHSLKRGEKAITAIIDDFKNHSEYSNMSERITESLQFEPFKTPIYISSSFIVTILCFMESSNSIYSIGMTSLVDPILQEPPIIVKKIYKIIE